MCHLCNGHIGFQFPCGNTGPFSSTTNSVWFDCRTLSSNSLDGNIPELPCSSGCFECRWLSSYGLTGTIPVSFSALTALGLLACVSSFSLVRGIQFHSLGAYSAFSRNFSLEVCRLAPTVRSLYCASMRGKCDQITNRRLNNKYALKSTGVWVCSADDNNFTTTSCACKGAENALCIGSGGTVADALVGVLSSSCRSTIKSL